VREGPVPEKGEHDGEPAVDVILLGVAHVEKGLDDGCVEIRANLLGWQPRRTVEVDQRQLAYPPGHV
jgi:hypothetical protein